MKRVSAIWVPWLLKYYEIVQRVCESMRFLRRNRVANQIQILCGASLGMGNSYKWPRSNGQDGNHAHIL